MMATEDMILNRERSSLNIIAHQGHEVVTIAFESRPSELEKDARSEYSLDMDFKALSSRYRRSSLLCCNNYGPRGSLDALTMVTFQSGEVVSKGGRTTVSTLAAAR